MRRTFFAVLAVLILGLLLRGTPEKIGKDQILRYAPQWLENYNDCQPDGQFIEMIKGKITPDLRVDVYLGLWCGDSKNNVPRFIKIMDLVGNPDVVVTFFNVKRSDKKGSPYFVEELKIERVPTFIFYRGNREIGRIIENPEKSLVEDILDIID